MLFEKGKFPNELKQSIVKPIFKNGNQRDQTNYRPISMLSTVSTIYFEKAMATRLS